MKPCMKVVMIWVLFLSCPFLANAQNLSVFVSILPQQYFVEQIAKDKVDVHVMVKPGASPATYEPKPTQMAALSKADIYFAVGAPFETFWLEKIQAANPDMTLVHTDHGIEKLAMAAHHHGDEDPDSQDHDTHDPAGHDSHDHDADHHEKAEHPEEDDHGHQGLDPHIWVAPELVKIQAAAISNALQAADPANKTFYQENAQVFIENIQRLDQELHAFFDDKPGTRFMVFHPAWGYFAHNYGLDQVPIEVEGKDPKPAQLRELIEYARQNNIQVIFAQPQFSAKSAKLVAKEIKGRVVFADPLALEWMDNMRAIAREFKEALK